MDSQQLIDTWEIHNRINLYLLDALSEAQLDDVASSKGRNVGSQFAHMHNVRLMWLKVADPGLFSGQTKIETGSQLSKELLATELKKSSIAISSLLDKAFKEGKVKNFKPHPSAFFAYLISHESHHRGQIMLALKQSGHPVDQKVMYGIWEWGSR